MKKNIKQFLFYLCLPIIGGTIIGLLTNYSGDYQSLVKPPLTPPNIVFPIVWTILYALMGISSYMIATTHDYRKKNALKIYYVQLGLNYLWPILFFNFQVRIISLLELFLLIYMVIKMIQLFIEIRKSAGILQIPYLIWCLFASYLNMGFIFLNI